MRLALALIALCGLVTTQTAPAPSLDETLTWIKNKLNTEAGWKPDGMSDSHISHAKFDGCTLSYDDETRASNNGEVFFQFKVHVTFRLADVDPDRIETERTPKNVLVVLHTRGNKEIVQTIGSIAGDTAKTVKVDADRIAVESPELADRLAKA